MTEQIHDTATGDRQAAIAEAGHGLDALKARFEAWWQCDGLRLPGADSPFIKNMAYNAWLAGASAALTIARP